MGQYFVHQQGSAFGHAACTAAGAEAAAFATEGHQVFRVTAVTAHPQETVLETTAFEVILKFPPNPFRSFNVGNGAVNTKK